MRWALNPTATPASTCGSQGRQELWRPDPAVEMAGFGSGSPSEPGVEMAGFDRASRRYLPIVSRLIPSSRAIRRCDQPCAAKVKIECCKLTLSWFIASLCRLHGTQRNASLRVAGFHSTLHGWFRPSADIYPYGYPGSNGGPLTADGPGWFVQSLTVKTTDRCNLGRSANDWPPKRIRIDSK